MTELQIPSRGLVYRPGDVINTDDFVFLLEEPEGGRRLAEFLGQLDASQAACLVAQTTLSLQALRRSQHQLHYELASALLEQYRRARRTEKTKRPSGRL